MAYDIEYCINPSTKKSYFNEYLEQVDGTTRKLLLKHIDKLKSGKFGTSSPLKNNFGNCDSMYEDKVDFGKGHRIYYRFSNGKLTIASAGMKKRQRHDVIVARGILKNKSTSI